MIQRQEPLTRYTSKLRSEEVTNQWYILCQYISYTMLIKCYVFVDIVLET